MTSPFSKVRDPDRDIWTKIEYDFPHGAHRLHVVEHMFAVVLFNVNDACRNLDIRRVPKLELNGRQGSLRRTLSVYLKGTVCKRVAIKIDDTGCLIDGGKYIRLDSKGAVARLALELLDIIEQTWNNIGRGL